MSDRKFSLDDLDARKASADAFEFEYIEDGAPTGVFLSVLGAHADAVRAETARIINERRRRDAVRSAKRSADFDTFEDDDEHGAQMAASRLVGWRGITDEFNAANALRLCKISPDIARQVLDQSNNMGNFFKR